MKHSKRFNDAVTKLYNAFHENRLDAWDCQMCAVGSMCDNTSEWSRFRIDGYNTGLNNFIIPKVGAKDAKISVLKSGYLAIELLEVERIFLQSFDGKAKKLAKDKESQFKGLCAVVEYLCELDGIPNVMDYTCLFETENNTPKVKLEEVFQGNLNTIKL